MQQAIESLHTYRGKYSYEIIVVDDGSTNETTLNLLEDLKKNNVTVLYQENKGPAAARNMGVKKSDSEFILFLDSDNKIAPDYIDEGVNRLKANTKACAVYGNPNFFGETGSRNFESIPFDIKRLLLNNYIDTCSVVRKQAWEDAGGMDEARELIGYEDWEFWINLHKSGWEFIHINKTMFYYRIRKESLIAQSSEEKFKKAVAYIYKKHWDLIYQVYHQLYSIRTIYKNDMRRPFRSFFKYLFKKQSI